MATKLYLGDKNSNSEIDNNRRRIISERTENNLFKFHWYVEYMLIGLAAFIFSLKTIDIFFITIPDYLFGISVDFLVAFFGVLTGLFLAKLHSEKLNKSR